MCRRVTKSCTGTTLTGGVRYSFDDHSMSGSFNNSGLPIGPGGAFIQIVPNSVETLPSFSDGSLSARVSLAHKFTSDAMVYVSFNEGTKSGGFNPVQINNAPFKDEKLSAYELGTKLRFWEQKGFSQSVRLLLRLQEHPGPVLPRRTADHL